MTCKWIPSTLVVQADDTAKLALLRTYDGFVFDVSAAVAISQRGYGLTFTNETACLFVSAAGWLPMERKYSYSRYVPAMRNPRV